MSEQPKIVILTGAGVSAESGIQTFRGQDGLWENHDILEVASPQGFQRNPSLVYDFYNQRRSQLLKKEIAPNKAHIALAYLEQSYAGEVVLITQNIDNLHERAGSKSIYHMHGELLKMRCQDSQMVFDCLGELNEKTICPCCHRPNLLRPHVVWFGEMPLQMEAIEKHLLTADIFVSIGTSAQVYPAAMFVQIASSQEDTKTIEINLEATMGSPSFQKHIFGEATQTVPTWVDTILKSHPKNSPA